jgi:membrane protease YdiL (CAAX protease family)
MKELQARELTEAFLKTKSAGRLVVNLLVMAVIPAIGEEMLFRGIVQRLFTAMVKNVHLGVIITAFLFSAFHLQFLGFLPRFFLGLMLGYAFVITGSLWTSVWLHFVNNASSVMVFYLHYNGFLKVSMDDFGNTQNMVYIIGSLLMAAWLFIMMYNKEGGEVRMKYFEKG